MLEAIKNHLATYERMTPDEIARHMPTGWRHCELSCPLAHDLMAFIENEGIDPNPEVEVGGGEAFYNEQFYDLPRSLAEFVSNFDAGAYPDLDKAIEWEQWEKEEEQE